MTTDATRMTLHYAQHRDETDASGDAAVVSTRTLMRGDATADDRAAHVQRALVAAGLVGTITPSLPRGYIDPLTGEARQAAWDRALTPQRLAVLRCFYDGLSYTETAEALHVNVSTIKSHTGNLYKMFGVSSKPECIVAAVRAGVLTPPGVTFTEPVVEVTTEAPEAPESPEAPDYGAWGRTALQDECRGRGLKASGNIATLIARILSDDVARA